MHSELFRTFVFLVAGNHPWAYAVLFVAAIFLGNLLSFAMLWLAFRHNLGAHPLGLVILTLFAAHVTGDVLWYSCGRALRDTKPGNWIRNHLPKHDALESHIQSNCSRWIFISEFLVYSAFPMFFLVGWMRIKFRQFFLVTVAAVASSFSILLIITYILVSTLSGLRAIALFRHLEILFGLGLVLFIILSYVLTLFVRKEFSKDENEF